MDKDITHYAKTRHTAKALDPNKKISDENIEKIKELLRYSPSSINSQPWHFILTSSNEGKSKIIKATDPIYPANSPVVKNASHVVIFCSKTDIDTNYLQKTLDQEALDGRLATEEEKQKALEGRSFFVNYHKDNLNDADQWTAKQAYLNLGAFLLGVSTLGIDATPMEGIDPNILDKEFGLKEKGYTSLVAVTLGYSDSKNDFNAKLNKSRLPYSEILTEV